MRELPILFSAPMVRAILEGRKTQTRRVIKPPPYMQEVAGTFGARLLCFPDRHRKGVGLIWPNAREAILAQCPYGQPGDRLWVREAWAPHPQSNETIFYKATIEAERGFPVWDGPWRPSIHMPRWASRITLEVTGVRVERLQDISDADAKNEGIEVCEGGAMDYFANDYAQGFTPKASFRSLWESLNGDSSWDANPWVWVVAFKRVEVR